MRSKQDLAEMRAMADAVTRKSPQFPDAEFNARNLAILLTQALDAIDQDRLEADEYARMAEGVLGELREAINEAYEALQRGDATAARLTLSANRTGTL